MFNFYLQNEYWFAAAQLIFAMLGMGATLTLRDLAAVFKSPKGFSAGLILQVIGVPVIAWIFIDVFKINTGVAVGIALCAAIPGGTVSNIITHFAKGHIALSISLTAVASIGCLITTPVILDFLIEQYMPNDFQMPAFRIACEIGICLLLPLAIGMLVYQYLPGVRDTFSKWCIRISLSIILLIVIGALGSGRVDLEAFGLNSIIVFSFISVVAIASMLVPILLRLNIPDTKAINIEITVRNTNLAVLIVASLFPASQGVDGIGSLAMFTVLLYGGLQLFYAGAIVFLGRKFAVSDTPSLKNGVLS